MSTIDLGDGIVLPLVGYVVIADGVDMTEIHTPLEAFLVWLGVACHTANESGWIVPVVNTDGWLTEVDA